MGIVGVMISANTFSWRQLGLASLFPLALAACSAGSSGGGSGAARGPVYQSTCGSSVNIYSGDTVYGIARRCNVSVRELIEANNLQAPYMLQAGTALRMPGGGGEYVVQRGDQLLLVARKLGVDFQTLARINSKAPPYTIYVGERLRLPGAFPNRGNGGETAVAMAPPSPRPTQQSAPVKSAPVPNRQETPPAGSSHAGFQPVQPIPPPPPAMAGKGFIWPVRGDVIMEFGPIAKGQNSDGINIAAPRGTPVKASENGVVAYAGNELKGFGNLILIKHADNWMTAYAHADQLTVKKGQVVKKGQQIATVGSTGGVSVPQLHFEVRRGTEAVNPMDYLKGDANVSSASPFGACCGKSDS